MQISKISSNNNYKNQTNFKGESEQKIFMKVLKVKELNKVIEESIDSKFSSEPVAQYFTKVFKKLEKHFSKNEHFKKSNNNNFIIKNGKEKIMISLDTEKKPHITYIEGKSFTKDLNQTNSIFYYGEINDHDPHISRQRFIGTALKKRLKVNLTGVDEKLSRYGKSFTFVSHSLGVLEKKL